MTLKISRRTLNRLKLAVVTSVLLLSGVALLNYSGQISPSPVSANNLREQFTGAYQKDVQQTGEVVEWELIAKPSQIELFDGYETKVWAYNNSVPGPELRVDLGDTLRVKFTNKLPQETTIHWHGVRVPNAMDGVPGVTQAPIEPGDTFVYEFTPKDPGTFWFHPHVRGSEQLERGLYGTLVVEDKVSQQYDQDVTWVVDDWRLTDDKQVDPRFVTTHDLAHDGRWGDVITVNGELKQQLEVKPGERIRLRLVNSSNGRVYAPQLYGLDVKVIAVDGMYVKQVQPLDEFTLAPGNRLDLDVKIPADTNREEYYLYDTFTRRNHTLGTIKINGQPVETPDFAYPTNTQVPVWDDAVTAPVDKNYRLNARRTNGRGMMGNIEWTINGKAYPNYDPFTFKFNEFNKIKFSNESARLHPMHLHGQFFKVISRNGKPVDEPYFRDTVLLESKETVEVGLVPLDKGEWAQHCHIQEHADAGMMNTVLVK